MWSIVLGDVVGSRLVKRPPRAYKMSLVTDQCTTTSAIQDLSKLVTSVQTGNYDSDALSYDDIWLKVVMIGARLAEMDHHQYELVTKKERPRYAFLVDYLQGLRDGKKDLLAADVEALGGLMTYDELVNHDDGTAVTELGRIIRYALRSFIDSETYEDALRLAGYLTRGNTYVLMLTSVMASLYYGRHYKLETNIKGMLAGNTRFLVEQYSPREEKAMGRNRSITRTVPKRFEAREIEELEVLPPVIGPFRGPFHFLSNFFLSPVHYENRTYSCVEGGYQAAKFVSPRKKDNIAKSQRPDMIKKMGQAKTGTRSDWFKVNLGIMEDLIRIKFQDPVLRSKLLLTKDAEIAEINTWNDTFFGVCNGVGQNHLGKIIMKIRKEIQDELNQ